MSDNSNSRSTDFHSGLSLPVFNSDTPKKLDIHLALNLRIWERQLNEFYVKPDSISAVGLSQKSDSSSEDYLLWA